MTTIDLCNLVKTGATVVLDARQFSTFDFTTIANSGKGHQGGLVIKNAGKLSAFDCSNISAANPGHVTFEF